MFEPQNLPTGYYRVRKGTHPRSVDGIIHPYWRVARWMHQSEVWQIGNNNTNFPRGYWDEIGDKVA